MAALLRDLMLRSGTSADAVEIRLGWESGRLNALLGGQNGLSFEALLEILPVLDSTPGDFFAQLCSFTPRGAETPAPAAQKILDRRFEESRRVVKAAIARRLSWKRERAAAL